MKVTPRFAVDVKMPCCSRKRKLPDPGFSSNAALSLCGQSALRRGGIGQSRVRSRPPRRARPKRSRTRSLRLRHPAKFVEIEKLILLVHMMGED